MPWMEWFWNYKVSQGHKDAPSAALLGGSYRGTDSAPRRRWEPSLIGMYLERATLSLVGHIPEPSILDEFSYLQRIRLPTVG
jgi:hypothetical protein